MSSCWSGEDSQQSNEEQSRVQGGKTAVRGQAARNSRGHCTARDTASMIILLSAVLHVYLPLDVQCKKEAKVKYCLEIPAEKSGTPYGPMVSRPKSVSTVFNIKVSEIKRSSDFQKYLMWVSW